MAKKLSEADLNAKLVSERPDGLVILSPEDVEAIAETVKHLQAEIKRLKQKAKAS